MATDERLDVAHARAVIASPYYDSEWTVADVAARAVTEVERLRTENAAQQRDLQLETDLFIEAGRRHEHAENWLTIERATSAKLRQELVQAQRENALLREVAQAVADGRLPDAQLTDEQMDTFAYFGNVFHTPQIRAIDETDYNLSGYVLALLAEVKRLRAAFSALREVAQAVADGRLPDGELAAIAARLAKATPGPWGFGWGQRGDDTGDWREIYAGDDQRLVIGTTGYDEGGMARQADAIFVRHTPEDIATLLAEVERLRRVEAENAALREVAQAVVAEDATMAYNDYAPDPNYCVFCEGHATHTSDCPVTRFRALLVDTLAPADTKETPDGR